MHSKQLKITIGVYVYWQQLRTYTFIMIVCVVLFKLMLHLPNALMHSNAAVHVLK